MQAYDGDGNTISPASGVVPILLSVDELQLKVVGTGFFLTRYGAFASAGHVLNELVNSQSGRLKQCFVLQHNDVDRFYIRQIIGISVSNVADVGMGQVQNDDGANNRRCPISFICPDVDETLKTYAFPENAIMDFRDSSATPRLRGDFFSGQFLTKNDRSARPFIPYDHYETTIDIRGGASGCPIFNSNRRAVALACRGWDFRGGEHEGENLSSIVPLTQLLTLELGCLRIPEQSWEFSQIPEIRRNKALTFGELVAYGHVDVGA